MPIPLASGLIAALGVLFRQVIAWIVANAGTFIMHILFTLGIYWVVAEPAGDVAIDYIQGKFDLIEGTVLETLIYLNVDDFFGLVFSAFAIRAASSASASIRVNPNGKNGPRGPATIGASSPAGDVL